MTFAQLRAQPNNKQSPVAAFGTTLTHDEIPSGSSRCGANVQQRLEPKWLRMMMLMMKTMTMTMMTRPAGRVTTLACRREKWRKPSAEWRPAASAATSRKQRVCDCKRTWAQSVRSQRPLSRLRLRSCANAVPCFSRSRGVALSRGICAFSSISATSTEHTRMLAVRDLLTAWLHPARAAPWKVVPLCAPLPRGGDPRTLSPPARATGGRTPTLISPAHFSPLDFWFCGTCSDELLPPAPEPCLINLPDVT